MRKLLFVMLAALAGCGGPMTKEGATSADVDRDNAECRYEAEKAAAGMQEGLERGLRRNEIMESCLRMRGYRAGR